MTAFDELQDRRDADKYRLAQAQELIDQFREWRKANPDDEAYPETIDGFMQWLGRESSSAEHRPS